VAVALVSKHHSVVELVDRAENAGLVRRVHDATDNRVVRLELTRDGGRILDRLGALTIEELSRLAPQMKKMWTGLELAGLA
jgi:DNA-binding MarR family transcriptional regulator